MKFINRNKELNQLERLSDAGRGGMAVLWGRRRVGKTRLLLEWSRREQRAPLQEHRRAQRSVQMRLPARREDHQVQASAQAHRRERRQVQASGQVRRRERRQVQASGQVRRVVVHHPARRLGMLSCVRPPLPSMWGWT